MLSSVLMALNIYLSYIYKKVATLQLNTTGEYLSLATHLMLRPTKALRQRPNNAFVSLYYVIPPSSLLYVSLSKIRYLVASLKPCASAPLPLAWPLGLSPSCGVIVGVGLHCKDNTLFDKVMQNQRKIIEY